MKNFLTSFLIVGFLFQCTDSKITDEFAQPRNLSPELREQLLVTSMKLTSIWRYRLQESIKKSFATKENLEGILEDYRKTIIDPSEREIFDALGRHPEMMKFVDWADTVVEEGVKGRASSTGAAGYNAMDYVSPAVTQALNQLEMDMDYTLATLQGSPNSEISSSLVNVVQNFEYAVYYNSSLTQVDKDNIAAAVVITYSSIPSIVEEMNEYDPYHQLRIANWDRFKRKIGSVIVHVVVCAIAVAVVGAIIVASGGAAGLMAPATLTLFGAWEVGFTAATLAYGAAAGLVVGTGAALADKCLSLGAGHTGYFDC